MRKTWTANWITTPGELDDDAVMGTTLLRREIALTKPVQHAALYASALGCYDLYLNGKRLGDRYFAPGYTQYTRRVQVQTYDVTDSLQGESLLLEAELSGGWYAGRLGLVLDGNRFGKKRAFLLELEIAYQDGSKETVITDESWQAAESPVRHRASFFDGEVYDASAEGREPQWSAARVLASANDVNSMVGVQPFREKEWQCIPELVEDKGEAVRSHEVIKPRLILRTGTEAVFDVGRNLAGIVCIEGLNASGGETLTIRHGEVLDNGKVYTGNLRTAKAELVYICKAGAQSWSPRFTFMGFRYFSVSSNQPLVFSEENFVVKELYSDMDVIGEFSCSNELLNQLQRNIQTSQKANFIDIPTDCPQRDERCGWTGDIATFASTAAYNMDCGRFLRRWLTDLNILQEDNGKGFTPYVAPDNAMGRRPGGGQWGKSEHSGSDAVWGDAAVIVPWSLYLSTGDKTILEEHYTGMKSQVDSVRRLLDKGEKDKSYIYKTGFQLGDWLAPGENIIKNMMKAKWTSTAYWANSAKIVSQAAEILEKSEDAKYYSALYERIREAFRMTFIKNGHIRHGFQSIYALAICFDLLDETERRNAANDLVADIRKRGNHLATGFVGTPYLPFALADTGHMDVAYDLLLQDTFPSWLYPVTVGATSIWERWDSLKPDGSINGAGDMVSFNHYSYGAVGDFLYRRVCGLEAIEPGYRRFRIAPQQGGGLTWAETSHRCPYGDIKVRWEQVENGLALSFTVPEGTVAEVPLTGRTYEPGTYTIKG